MKYLLIGYGNPLRGDDGVGPAVAERFEAEAASLIGDAAGFLRVVTLPQLVPELAEVMAKAERVVLVDASRGMTPGEVGTRRVEPSPEASENRIHAYDPSTLAAWAGNLYGNCPEVHIVAVGAETFSFGQGLSPDVAEAIPGVLREIAALFLAPDKSSEN